jgi:hypothetical protein
MWEAQLFQLPRGVNIFLAVVILLWCVYATLDVVAKWNYRNTIEKGIWFVLIATIGAICINAILPY